MKKIFKGVTAINLYLVISNQQSFPGLHYKEEKKRRRKRRTISTTLIKGRIVSIYITASTGKENIIERNNILWQNKKMMVFLEPTWDMDRPGIETYLVQVVGPSLVLRQGKTWVSLWSIQGGKLELESEN